MGGEFSKGNYIRGIGESSSGKKKEIKKKEGRGSGGGGQTVGKGGRVEEVSGE